MSVENRSRSGHFAHNMVPDDVQRIIELVERDRADWAMAGDLIAVRCHDDPNSYRIVVARVVHETEELDADK